MEYKSNLKISNIDESTNQTAPIKTKGKAKKKNTKKAQQSAGKKDDEVNEEKEATQAIKHQSY